MMKKVLLSAVLLTAVMAAVITPYYYNGDHPGVIGQEKNVQETL